MDPLSDILSLLKPQSYSFRALEASGKWSIQFPANEGIRCYALLSGQCWLVIEGVPEAIRFAAGDCILMTKKQSFRMASDVNMTPIDGVAFFSATKQGGVATCNGGRDVTGIGGYFEITGKYAAVLLSLLPAIVHIRKESSRAALWVSMELMMEELREHGYRVSPGTLYPMMARMTKIGWLKRTKFRPWP